MKRSGRLLVIERIGSPEDPLGSAMRGLTMLVLFGSCDRTTEQYIELHRQAGLTIRRQIVTDSGLLLLESTV
jgi:hypothetical protein